MPTAEMTRWWQNIKVQHRRQHPSTSCAHEKPKPTPAVCVAPCKTFSHTFTKAGTLTYHDKDHPGMVGTVVVRGPSRLPRTAEGAPDMTGYVLIFAVIALAGGLLLRHRLVQTGR